MKMRTRSANTVERLSKGSGPSPQSALRPNSRGARLVFGTGLFPVLLTASLVWGTSETVLLAADSGHAAASDDEGGEQGQSAPLDFKSDLALWSLVTFLIFLAVLKKFAWGPLITGLDSREASLRQAVADAELAKNKAKRLVAEHEERLAKAGDEVREILAEARRDAERTKSDIMAAAQTEAEATTQRARDEIALATDHALQEIFDQMADRVAAATEHVLGRALNDSDQDRLIGEALAEVAET